MELAFRNARSVADTACSKEPQTSIDRKTAHDILGKNLFGPEQWLKFFGIWFSEAQLREISMFPWNKDILESPCPFFPGSIKNTHFAFLGLYRLGNRPLTVLEWQRLHPIAGGIDTWCEEQDFARVKACWFRWHLMPIKRIPYSEGMSFQEQESMLRTEYRVSSTIEEVTKNILFYKVHKQFPNNPGDYVRCKDLCVCKKQGAEDMDTEDINNEPSSAKAQTCHVCVFKGTKTRSWSSEIKRPHIGISASRLTPARIEQKLRTLKI